MPPAGLPGLDHQTLAGAGNGLRHLSVWRQTIAAGAATPAHRHDCEEVIVVASGHGELHVEGRVYRFGADCTLVLPASVDHQLINTGSEPLHLIAALSMAPVQVLTPDGRALPLPWQA
ncbi:MAG: cupin domain-containing protein [Gammaproteobacteria bacterium]|nr:cupin domain-containing protein [Gammaproteobacteria bacterium]